MAVVESAGVAPAPKGLDAADRRAGLITGISCYVIWGFFPILFRALDGVPSLTVVAHRFVWSFLLVGAILIVRNRLDEVKAVLRSGKAMLGILIAATLLSGNWLIFVFAVDNDKVLDVSFGYFINPLVSVIIGMVLLGERMNRLQWVSISIAAIAIAIQAIGLQDFPWISLSLAGLFGFYGYVRKTVEVESMPGLFLETMVMLPAVIAWLGYTFLTEGPGVHADPVTFSLLVATGPATSLALILFVFAARRLRLSTMGMLQYLAPSMHFGLAIWLFGEPLNPVQLLSFALIWVSLIVFTFDSFKNRRRRAGAH